MADHEQPGEEVFRTQAEQACVEHALVLRAMGIRCTVQPDVDGFTLVVSQPDALKARAELEAYTREKRGDTIQVREVAARTDGWAGALTYASVILLVAVCADRQLLGLDWFDAGEGSARLIHGGEWWRTFTALTLHADRAHLVANLVIGGLFGLFAARLLGSGLAWFSILIGGAAGNALNAWLRPVAHTSVGASTAIFAALGIISAWAWTRRRLHPVASLARWTPLIGGVVLLAYLGGGGARVDVGAHICGFVSGVVLGTAFGRLGVHARLGNVGQALLAIGALILLVLAWAVALVTSGGLGTTG